MVVSPCPAPAALDVINKALDSLEKGIGNDVKKKDISNGISRTISVGV